MKIPSKGPTSTTTSSTTNSNVSHYITNFNTFKTAVVPQFANYGLAEVFIWMESIPVLRTNSLTINTVISIKILEDLLN